VTKFVLSMDLTRVEAKARCVAMVLRAMADDLDAGTLAECGKLWLHDGDEYGQWTLSDGDS